jgi:hypothetical protein
LFRARVNVGCESQAKYMYIELKILKST